MDRDPRPSRCGRPIRSRPVARPIRKSGPSARAVHDAAGSQGASARPAAPRRCVPGGRDRLLWRHGRCSSWARPFALWRVLRRRARTPLTCEISWSPGERDGAFRATAMVTSDEQRVVARSRRFQRRPPDTARRGRAPLEALRPTACASSRRWLGALRPRPRLVGHAPAPRPVRRTAQPVAAWLSDVSPVARSSVAVSALAAGTAAFAAWPRTTLSAPSAKQDAEILSFALLSRTCRLPSTPTRSSGPRAATASCSSSRDTVGGHETRPCRTHPQGAGRRRAEGPKLRLRRRPTPTPERFARRRDQARGARARRLQRSGHEPHPRRAGRRRADRVGRGAPCRVDPRHRGREPRAATPPTARSRRRQAQAAIARTGFVK